MTWPALADTELTVRQMRQAGFVVLNAGNARQALIISDALLARDPDDVAALILRSRALRNLGDAKQAITVARKAWSQAATDDQKFGAALTMAQALSSAGGRSRAQFWLRRAAEVAPNDQAKAVAIRDFRYVQRRNPLTFSIDVTASPSTNVNNGAANETAEIYGIPFVLSPDARALSGFQAGLGLSARLRRPASASGQTEYRLSLSYKQVLLSAEAKAAAPTARGSDYNFGVVELGWQRRFGKTDGNMSYTVGATLGRNWYGPAVLSDYGRVDLSARKGFSRQSAGQVAVYAEHQIRHDSANYSADVLGITGSVDRVASNGDHYRWSLGFRDTASASTSIAHNAVTASMSWTKRKPVAGVGLSAQVALEQRHYPVFPLSASGDRQDLRVTGTLSMTLNRVEYFGFSPVINLTATQTDSSLGLYDSHAFGLSFGIRSSF